MTTTWQHDGLSTEPPSTTMAAADKRSLAVSFPAPADIQSATALLRTLSDDTTVAIDAGSVSATTSSVTVLVDGDTLTMAKGFVYRLEVQAIRSTGIEETARLVIECPA